LRKALSEGELAQQVDKSEFTNVILRLARKIWLSAPEEGARLYQRAYNLIPDSNPNKEVVAVDIQRARQLAFAHPSLKPKSDVALQVNATASKGLDSEEREVQEKIEQELRVAEVASKYKHENEIWLWAQLAITEANSARLDDAYAHAKKAIECYQAEIQESFLTLYALEQLMPTLTEKFSKRNAERLYQLTIDRIRTSGTQNKKHILIFEALLFKHYVDTKQFSKAAHYLSTFTRGSGRDLNVTHYEVSGFNVIEKTILALQGKHSEEALKFQKLFIACEKLELPADHERFVSLLRDLAKIEKSSGHANAAVAALSDSVKLDSKYLDADILKDKLGWLADRNDCPEFDYAELLAGLKQASYSESAIGNLQKQLVKCEGRGDWSQADQVALKLCDIVEHQDDTHAGRQVGCIITGPESYRTDPFVASARARHELRKSKSGVQIIKRALKNLPDLSLLELEKLANASIDCGDLILATKIADASQKMVNRQTNCIEMEDLTTVWKRLNRPDKVTECNNHSAQTEAMMEEERQNRTTDVFYQTRI
jgi:tetratricopeptide (TPR) repeat protein